LVIYSAQAYGCPVVVTDLEGMTEVVDHEVNGLLFPLGDAEGLAEALRRLARDADLLARLRRNARRPKTIAQYAAECVAVYEEVLGRHLKAPGVDTKPFEPGQGQAESA
jgi:glycosyltransferase involved in cell wall biosynthesis